MLYVPCFRHRHRSFDPFDIALRCIYIVHIDERSFDPFNMSNMSSTIRTVKASFDPFDMSSMSNN